MSIYITLGFALFVVGVVLYAVSVVLRKPAAATDPHSDHCSLCGEKHPKELLVERMLVDSAYLFLCPDCIRSLHRELTRGGAPTGPSRTSRSSHRRKGKR